MQESSSNEHKDWPKHEIFSETYIPPEAPFFVRLDGWRFSKILENINVEKPFDEKLAKCLASSGKILFKKGFSPALVYVASDEINILFLDEAPFRRRIEKIDSVMASLVSSAFTLDLRRILGREKIAAFDSRIIVVSNEEKVIEYLAWRQMDTWRNHNNAYVYWVFRKMGQNPSEISRRLKGLNAKELHKIMFKQGINLARTPKWQRRGILVHKQPFIVKTKNHAATRWKINENWNLPLFTSADGEKLIKQILEWTRQKRKT